MEEKLTIIVESEDNDIEKLILNAAPESILHKKFTLAPKASLLSQIVIY